MIENHSIALKSISFGEFDWLIGRIGLSGRPDVMRFDMGLNEKPSCISYNIIRI